MTNCHPDFHVLDLHRCTVPSRLLPLSVAAILALETEKFSLDTLLKFQRIAQDHTGSSGEYSPEEIEPWAKSIFFGLKLARRLSLQQCYVARALFKEAMIRQFARRAKPQKPYNLFAVYYWFVAEPSDGLADYEYAAFMGKRAIEARIVKSDEPEATANLCAALVTSAIRDLEESGFAEQETEEVPAGNEAHK